MLNKFQTYKLQLFTHNKQHHRNHAGQHLIYNVERLIVAIDYTDKMMKVKENDKTVLKLHIWHCNSGMDFLFIYQYFIPNGTRQIRLRRSRASNNHFYRSEALPRRFKEFY